VSARCATAPGCDRRHFSAQLHGRNLADISALSLAELGNFAAGLPGGLPAELSRLTTGLLAELDGRLRPLLDLGLSYLTLDRPGDSLSTGERQRIELTSTVRASTTGMLYVLDEPSVGLHPSNVVGLRNTIAALAGNGNSADLYNLHDLTAAFPVNRLTALAGPSGAGKTALVLDSLVPAARARLSGSAHSGHVRRLDLRDIRQVVQIDASPIGQNTRPTPATYCGAFDHIRGLYAGSAYAQRRRWKAGHFSFNTREEPMSDLPRAGPH
jgi:excinuclease UvrABC ATPase subunit